MSRFYEQPEPKKDKTKFTFWEEVWYWGGWGLVVVGCLCILFLIGYYATKNV